MAEKKLRQRKEKITEFGPAAARWPEKKVRERYQDATDSMDTQLT